MNMKQNNWISVEWNGKQYLYNSKTNKYKVRIFIMGTGWTTEKCTKEEFQQVASARAKVMANY
jgi:hypothetical protein